MTDAAKKYKPATIKQERLKLVAARLGGLKSRDGSLVLPTPQAREDIANALPLLTPPVGEMVSGKGVFIGQWQPADRNGKNLGRTFNVYAAPEDLRREDGSLLFTFNEAVAHLATVKDWHGHDGGSYKTDTELYNALDSGGYNGEWVFPTRELLSGRAAVGGETIREETLFSLQNEGALKDSFHGTVEGGSWYWSCSERDPGDNYAWVTNLGNNKDSAFYNGNTRGYCRPVRFEEVKP